MTHDDHKPWEEWQFITDLANGQYSSLGLIQSQAKKLLKCHEEQQAFNASMDSGDDE